jgi:hypothetical protein
MKVLGLVVLVAIGVIAAVAYGIGGSSSTSTTSTTTSTTAAAETTAADADAEKPGPAYLFSFFGTNATVTPVAGSEVAYDVSVPVDAVSNEVAWFTDRPNRDAGTMSVEALASLWTKEGTDSFTADPPNVSIVFGSGKGQPRTAIAEMSNTKIVDNPSGEGQLLQATMTVATDQEAAEVAKGGGLVAVHATRHTTPKTITNADAKNFAVFIDDYASANGCVYKNDWCTGVAGAPGDAQWGSCSGFYPSGGQWSNYANSIYNRPTAITCMGYGYNGKGLDVHGVQH